MRDFSSGSRGGPRGPWPPPGPVKIGHKKDGRHVSRPPPYPAAGSATGFPVFSWVLENDFKGTDQYVVKQDFVWVAVFQRRC